MTISFSGLCNVLQHKTRISWYKIKTYEYWYKYSRYTYFFVFLFYFYIFIHFCVFAFAKVIYFSGFFLSLYFLFYFSFHLFNRVFIYSFIYLFIALSLSCVIHFVVCPTAFCKTLFQIMLSIFWTVCQCLCLGCNAYISIFINIPINFDNFLSFF